MSMTGDGGIGGRCMGDLPDDLLCPIYRRCSTPYDRARFSAVCRSWRAAASWQPKLPGMPLLLNSTGNGSLDRKERAYSPEDGRVLQAPLLLFPYGKRIVGCYDGGWVAAAIGWRLDIVNLFTHARVLRKGYMTYSYDDDKSMDKIIFSKDPSSQGCILAVMTRRRIKLYKIGKPDGWLPTHLCGVRPNGLEDIVDIAFCNGYLYGLTSSGDLLYKLDIDPNKGNPTVVFSLEKLTIQRPVKFDPQYIFELRGKLATAMEVTPITKNEARSFMVFELASSGSSKYTWADVTSLGDHALFLGPGCCKAVHVSAAGMRGKVESNRIYYSKHLDDDVDSKCLPRWDLGSCVVYSYESKEELRSDRIMSHGYHYSEKYEGINGRNTCTWILPPHF